MTPDQLREGKWCEHDRVRKDCEFCELERFRRAHAAALEENAKLAARVLVLEKIIGLNVLLAARSK